ncbi:hypothetical protein JD276_01645 [Leucobacter sp. CSA1]|uniref:Multidrug ABC transporter ATPase n=1 Tax=Leucobacter chromiisoli TaxID=2796471 RepID=A0A934UTV4_9MICO|nr:hypothetical protein [Leucobacter chromiisoli]MBK0417741.1 hypothetical protein [Leucobacter chromiisoli]
MSSTSSTPSALERILAYATLTIIAAAVVSFFTTLIVGLNDREALAGGIWQFVFGISYIGLPIGLVLLILLLAISMRRRKKEASAATPREKRR